ncbi:MAG: hypothetical protein J7513_13700 [Solirubrobacteraceae bacterium]|nr:hypothetical protein [Solirubrobacteraceae bacterium]
MAARFSPGGALRLGTALPLLLAASACVTATPASAAQSVAYLDGKEVWVANLDGSSKTRLSTGQGDWTAVAQNDNGWIVGVQLEAGKIAQLSRFTVWNPQGQIVNQGPLTSKNAGASAAYPLGLNITASGGTLVYGYSEYTYGYPVGTLVKGFFVLPSSTKTVTPPLSVGSAQYLTLGPNDRVVGSTSETSIGIQGAGGLGVTAFQPSQFFSAPFEIWGVDTSGDGTVVATSLYDNSAGSGTAGPKHVHFTKWVDFGGTVILDDCFLDQAGTARDTHGTVSTDGTRVAWEGLGGVKVAGAPSFTSAGPPTCNLSSPPVTISATGTYPSLGGFDLNAYVAANAPAAGGGGAAGGGTGGTGAPAGGGTGSPATPALTATLKSAPKLSTLTSKTTVVSVKLTASATGEAKVELKIPPKNLGLKGRNPITLAAGKAKVTAGQQKTVKLKPTSRARTLRKKLKGKKATLRVKIGALTSESTIKLG